MRNNNFFMFSLICLFIVCLASNFNLIARIALGTNAVIVLVDIILSVSKLRRYKNGK